MSEPGATTLLTSERIRGEKAEWMCWTEIGVGIIHHSSLDALRKLELYPMKKSWRELHPAKTLSGTIRPFRHARMP